MSRLGSATKNFWCIGCGRLKVCRFSFFCLKHHTIRTIWWIVKVFREKLLIFLVLVHFVKGVKNRYMYLNFKFYFRKVLTLWRVIWSNYHYQLTGWVLLFLVCCFRSVFISHQHRYNLNNFYNFRALFKFNILFETEKRF